jgi:hypothetical protein
MTFLQIESKGVAPPNFRSHVIARRSPIPEHKPCQFAVSLCNQGVSRNNFFYVPRYVRLFARRKNSVRKIDSDCKQTIALM